MDKLQCDQNCIHCPVCGHKEQFKKYFEEHISLREKYDIFDSQPECQFYLNKLDIHIFENWKRRDESKNGLLNTSLDTAKTNKDCTTTIDNNDINQSLNTANTIKTAKSDENIKIELHNSDVDKDNISKIYDKVKEATKKEPIVFGSKDDLIVFLNDVTGECTITKDDNFRSLVNTLLNSHWRI